MSFEWNTFYTHFEKKIKKEYPKCKVGRYITPKQADFPYCDVALSDISGGNYDLEGNEGSQTPMITISVYATGSLADNTCYSICSKAKEIMLAVIGTRVIYIRLNKEGVLLMRNCGEKYENTEGTDVHFRFDYTLM